MKIDRYKKGMYFAIALVLVGGLLGACSAGAAPSSRSNSTTTTQNTSADTTSMTIHVTTTEMSFAFDTVPTQAGKITFVIENRGHIEHNFVLQGPGREVATKMIRPGSSETLTVELEPGQYNFVCGVLGHGIAGMRGSFTLT